MNKDEFIVEMGPQGNVLLKTINGADDEVVEVIITHAHMEMLILHWPQVRLQYRTTFTEKGIIVETPHWWRKRIDAGCYPKRLTFDNP